MRLRSHQLLPEHLLEFVLKTSKILTVSSNFDICSFVQISRNLGVFASCRMCYILGNKQFRREKFQHGMHFTIFVKRFIYFTLSVPGVLKRTHPKNEQNRSSS